jgi:NAD(P)-dependent dehydrogenase (short-subunit alcohol dehydrogenase family)
MAITPKFDITPEKEASFPRYLYRQFIAKTPALTRRDVNLSGKTAIVTGSNTGIGREIGRQLLDLGLSKLILAVRSPSKGEVARKELSANRAPGSFEIDVWSLDLSSYDSIVAFAARAKTLDRLDIAVLNAGLWKVTENFVPGGFEESIQINYLSNILLMTLLLPVLKSTPGGPPGRLVLVSSDTAGWVKFDERTARPILPAFKKKAEKWDMQERYGTSKLLGQLFVTELAQRVPASSVTVVTANPGMCYGSELSREGNGTVLGSIFKVVQRILGKPAHLGARTIVHGAVSFGKEAHGQYIEDGKIRPSVLTIL